MDFARRQLLKYGWEEGKGLGKNESGISEALKPTLKFDTTGVGHDSSEQFTFKWWENVYNQAADNINVVKSKDGKVNMKMNTEESVDITTKKYSYKNLKKNNNLEYGCFLKTSKLIPSGVVDHDDKVTVTTGLVENIKVAKLTDEELFAACGGRTAHKGARHGLQLNGKLARIEEQEVLLLMKIKKEAKSLETGENFSQDNYTFCEANSYESKNHKKKKSKKKKDVSLLESNDESGTVIEAKSYKKRKHSLTENDEEIELAVIRKTAEYMAKQEIRKNKKVKNLEIKKISKITNMLENVCVLSQQENTDDGFDEKSKTKKDKTIFELNDETGVGTEAKSYKKRKHSQTVNDEECDSALVQKTTEYYMAKQERRKKKKIKKLERKKISKITNMLENVCVSSQQENRDDGFEEKSKTVDEDESLKKKHRKKKRKLNLDAAKNNEKDDGFEEYISEVNEKLMYYKELRKDLHEEKLKGDEKRISKMAEDFQRKL